MRGTRASDDGPPERGVRAQALAATLAVHAGLLALLLVQVAEPVRPVVSALTMFDVTGLSSDEAPTPPKAPQPKPVPPTPPQPVVVPPTVLPTPSAMVVALLDQAETATMGGACDLTGPVQAALQSSELVAASVPQIPRDQRSVANAIMVWNAGWIAPDTQLEPAAFDAIRHVIAETVAAASAECRLQPQGGPRLIMLTGATENTVLALGSGTWRWQDLLDTAQPSDAETQTAAIGTLPSILATLQRALVRDDQTNGSPRQAIAAAVRQ